MVEWDAEKIGDAPPNEGFFAHEFGRVRKILRPDGKKLHIAQSPEEVEKLKRTLSSISPLDQDWEVVIHGSLEHVNALRESHSHQEELRQQLRLKHGKDFDEFEKVVKELDRLSNELHMVSHHAVNLDANFSKYGYSATLRTLPASGESSASPSMHNGHTPHEHRDWEAEKQNGEHMVFWKTPVIRQYFHKGYLWRSPETTEVSSYELFIDLLYVGIIGFTGDAAADDANGGSLLRFAVTFTLGWKVWSENGKAIAWIASDDIMRRLSVLFYLTILLGLTTNMTGYYGVTYKPLIAFYILGRWFGAAYYFSMAYLIPMVRPSMIGSGIVGLFPGFIWIGSTFVAEPNREALVWVALFLDIFAPVMLVALERGRPWMGERLSNWCQRTFEFMPGNNIEHKIERTDAFVALVFGYSVVSLLYQSAVPFGINAFFGKAALGLIQSFAFNWLYFEVDRFNLHTHAIRRHFFSAIVWLSVHLPFVMSFTLSASALAKLVLAHDTAESKPEYLLGQYAAKSEAEISPGLVWYYCAGLAIALASMGVIALTHQTKVIPNARLGRTPRLAVRFAAAMAILLLPLAKDRFTSLTLVGTTCSIVVLVLLTDLAGTTCRGDDFWNFGETGKCTYSASARISRKEMIEKVKSGEVVNVEQLAKKGGQKHLCESLIV